MQPGLVWLQLIPLFGQLWQFFAVTRIAGSIRKEIASRQDDSVLGFSDSAAVEEHGKQPTLMIGIAYCILFTIGVTMNFSSLSPDSRLNIIASLCSLSGMICWIIYWVRLAQYKKKLKMLRI
jgi:hypothetical protein